MTMLARSHSIRYKLMMVVLATTLTALLVMAAAMVIYDARTYKREWVSDLMTQANIIGISSVAALSFDDRKAAAENLSTLKLRPQILGAAIYTARGALFATYAKDGAPAAAVPTLPQGDGYDIDGDEIVVFKRIADDKEILGTVYLRARYALFARIGSYASILAAVITLCLVVALAVSFWLNAVVTKPILAITALTRKVREGRDFTLRADRTTDDEIGYLADGFNDMLAEIGQREKVMADANRSLAEQVEERAAAAAALRASEERNRLLIAAMTSVVCTMDARGRFAVPQPSWSAYTGQSADASIGLGWHGMVHAEDRTALELAFARGTVDAARFDLELRVFHAASGTHRHAALRVVPFQDPQGAIAEWIATLTDIHDQRVAEIELTRLNTELESRVARRTSELEAANKELESFSYSVSHDLRAPVRAIAGFSRMLYEDHSNALGGEGLRKLDIVQGEAKRMGMLIDDLLAFSRLGRKPLDLAELDIEALVRSLLERTLAHHEGPRPDVRIGALPKALADRSLLEQVWANLLSNALKYSSKRAAPVIEIAAISEERDHVYFVRDNGAGFDPRYKAKLFGVFQRLHDAGEFPGTGVGLALVHRIVARHGGRVWADGEPDKGATFYFTLPKEPSDDGR
jgi:PAS domain S-box-containing protein